MTDLRGIGASADRVAQALIAGDVADLWRIDGEIGPSLAGLTAGEFLDLDDCVRRVYHGWDRVSAWSRLKVSHVKALRYCEAIPTAVVGVLSFHGDGYIREAAVRVLDNVGTGTEVRYLLVRINDWVPVIRETALEAIERRLRAEYAEAFVLQVDLIVRLESWKRADHSELLASIVRLLRKAESRPALSRALDRAGARERRLLYSLLLTGAESGRLLLHRALADPDPLCRLEAMRRLPYEPELLHVALRDSFSGVRLLAARLLAFGKIAEPEAIFVDLLMDPASMVRGLARHRLGTGTDFARVYRQHLEDPALERVVIALWGIAETGDVASLPRVKLLVASTTARVAAAAVRTLAVLDGDNHVTELLAALRSPILAVVRAAALALFPRRALLDQTVLWEMSRELTSVTARRRALNLLFHGPKWSAVLYILECVADPEPEVASLARVALERWMRRFNSIGTPLPPDQQPRLQATLKAVWEHLPADTARELEFCLRS